MKRNAHRDVTESGSVPINNRARCNEPHYSDYVPYESNGNVTAIVIHALCVSSYFAMFYGAFGVVSFIIGILLGSF